MMWPRATSVAKLGESEVTNDFVEVCERVTNADGSVQGPLVWIRPLLGDRVLGCAYVRDLYPLTPLAKNLLRIARPRRRRT